MVANFRRSDYMGESLLSALRGNCTKLRCVALSDGFDFEFQFQTYNAF